MRNRESTFQTKKQERKRSRLEREKAQAEAEKQRKELLDTLSVVVYQKGFNDGRFEDSITLRFSYANHASKDIRGFKGTIIFKDLFGDEIMRSELKEDGILRAGQRRRVRRSIGYNQFMKRHKKLRSTSLENMKIAWKPELILFTDGTSLLVTDE